MALRFATAFTGIPANASAKTTDFNTLFAEADNFSTLVQVLSGAGNAEVDLVNDPVFPTRRSLSLKFTTNSGTNRYWNGVEFSALTWDSSLSNDLIVGFTIWPEIDSYTSIPSANYGLNVGTTALSKVSSNNLSVQDPSDLLVRIDFGNPENGGYVGKFCTVDGATESYTAIAGSPSVLLGQWGHLELHLERTTKRIRTYFNGLLVSDNTWVSADLDRLMAGVRIFLYKDYPPPNRLDCRLYIGNPYLLEVDAVHTGLLGPNARVVEYKPSTDVEVNYLRNGSQPSNALVAAQTWEQADPESLVASDAGTFDLYQGHGGITTDAVQIYAAAVRYRARNPSVGSHNMAGAFKVNGVLHQGPQALLSNQTATFGSDISINPSTGSVWTPFDLGNSPVGFKLVT